MLGPVVVVPCSDRYVDRGVGVDVAAHVPNRVLLGADCPGADPKLTVVLTWAEAVSSLSVRRPGRFGLSVVRSA